ncbi:MAG: uroporphyrinogen decarboxylase [Nitratireductor sp.]|nr:uroporphyrinogen decarboxylase [Nitratireductor sp.]
MEKTVSRKVLNVLQGKKESVSPVWVMRQAGRYLPEYRETRRKAGGFLDLCYTPELAVEVTLQPIRRFGFDASILFSDILVIPHAMGRDVRFEEGRGPLVDPISELEIDAFVGSNGDWEALAPTLRPVLEAVSGIRSALPDETTLLGFCGAPWTVATYMIAGHSTSDQAPARLFAHRFPDRMEALLGVLAERSADYLIRQLQAGADAVQIFDSWSGVLDPQGFEALCVRPVRRIVDRVRAAMPDARIIGFPKGAAWQYADYAAKTGVDAVGLDWTVPLSQAREWQKSVPVQGNLDPTRLVAGDRALDEGVDRILEALGDGPHIFNLGHGITPDTPVAHVERMLKRIRG